MYGAARVSADLVPKITVACILGLQRLSNPFNSQVSIGIYAESERVPVNFSEIKTR
jgi:hypothetical protein